MPKTDETLVHVLIQGPYWGKKAGRLLKVSLFYFHSIGVSFVDGDCSPDQRLL